MKSFVATLIRSALVFALTAGTAMAAELQPAEWRDYAARFISPEGRVIDTGNGGISHSEGQGYGMILATAFDDREQFDHLWQWTQRELQVRRDALFSWKWEPGAGKVTDSNSASDGDILIAWALLRADQRWQVPAYRTAAARILASVRAKLIAPSPFGPMLLPGPEGFRHGATLVVNPSYWVFPAFADFAVADPIPSGCNWCAAGSNCSAEAVSASGACQPTGSNWAPESEPATVFRPTSGSMRCGSRSMCCGPISALMIPRWKAICGAVPAVLDRCGLSGADPRDPQHGERRPLRLWAVGWRPGHRGADAERGEGGGVPGGRGGAQRTE